MKISKKRITYRTAMFLAVLSLQGMLAACGQEPETEVGEPQIISSETAENSAEDSVADASETTPPAADEMEEDTETTSSAADEIEEEMDAMQEMFGRECISDQTFEVQISECEQEVYFVPYVPTQENPEFHAQIIQNGQVLDKLSTYVPDELAGEEFSSLDAVSFFDINFDGNTDILLLETYGNTRFVAVYYGDSWISYDEDIRVYFIYRRNCRSICMNR